ncbi:MAG: A/G-specific adenine glycosylase [Planctomycetota bacterium]|nr:A/G-specific adenine glycosylase [Planctomycetota bacterium]
MNHVPVENGIPAAPPALEPRTTSSIAGALEAWFPEAARELPWRTRRSGYHALVSEAMLQQTQVARVVDSFLRFVARFPTVESLAEADEQDVLALWQGLGYYRRARNLHAAARMVCDEFDGEVPGRADLLLKLPGVGRYTAGAIASIVNGERAPIVDGNVARVLSRLARFPGRPGERAFDRWCWSQSEAMVLSASDPGVLNEAMMELGATVCTKHSPACDRCPASAHCRAAVAGDPQEFPTPKPPPARKVVHHHALLLTRTHRNRSEVFLQQRPDEGLWARMWQPPTLETDRRLSLSELGTRWKVDPRSMDRSLEFTHRTSHRDVCFHVHVTSSRPGVELSGRWHPAGSLGEIPLANPHARMIRDLAGGS